MARIDRELDHQYRMRKVQAVSVGWLAFTRFLCLAVFCVFAYLTVRELAGKDTKADLAFKVLADLKASKYFGLLLPWGLAGMATTYGLGQRYLRKSHIKRVSSEASKMQQKLDPGRRSSHLSKKGETTPEDF